MPDNSTLCKENERLREIVFPDMSGSVQGKLLTFNQGVVGSSPTALTKNPQ
jgi:hypothetical protein